MKYLAVAISTASLVVLIEMPARAHGIATSGVLDGLTHPLLGLDHLLLLLAVGTAASLISSRLLIWALGGAVIGAIIGSAGLSLPAAEVLAALAISSIGFLAFIVSRIHQKSNHSLYVISGFIVAAAIAIHAMLHGLEAPKEASAWSWWAGAFFSSVSVCSGTYFLVRQLPTAWIRWVAVLFMVIGLFLALGPLGLLAGGVVG